MSITLNLVQGAMFHNGKEFSAEDVAFTIERIKNPELSSQFAPQNVTTVETPDEYTVVQFAAPTPAILDYLLNVQIVTEQDIDLIGERPIAPAPSSSRSGHSTITLLSASSLITGNCLTG